MAPLLYPGVGCSPAHLGSNGRHVDRFGLRMFEAAASNIRSHCNATALAPAKLYEEVFSPVLFLLLQSSTSIGALKGASDLRWLRAFALRLSPLASWGCSGCRGWGCWGWGCRGWGCRGWGSDSLLETRRRPRVVQRSGRPRSYWSTALQWRSVDEHDAQPLRVLTTPGGNTMQTPCHIFRVVINP